MTYYTHYIFTDTLRNKTLAILAHSLDNAYEQLCGKHGTGYVMENIEFVM